MLCDAFGYDEIYEAFVLYASLHGLDTSEEALRARIDRYVANEPDEAIDDALLAYTDDEILAPPDVVLEPWGRSRVYELEKLTVGGWRHRVCENWFENNCSFDGVDIPLSHFWTSFHLEKVAPDAVSNGMRVSLKFPRPARSTNHRTAATEVSILHRDLGLMGSLSNRLAEELAAECPQDMRYLPLVDTVQPDIDRFRCVLLVTRATPDLPITAVVQYAAAAIQAPRKKC